MSPERTKKEQNLCFLSSGGVAMKLYATASYPSFIKKFDMLACADIFSIVEMEFSQRSYADLVNRAESCFVVNYDIEIMKSHRKPAGELMIDSEI